MDELFYSGKAILSIGGLGCNLKCPFYQNHEISMPHDKRQRDGSAYILTPEDIVSTAIQYVPQGNIGVAYTYNEPLIGYEYLTNCAKLVHGAGLKNVLVTNGAINREPLEELLPLIDAMNIDIKGFTNEFYQKIGGDLETVKQTITLAHSCCHIEATTLVIPNENEEDIEAIAKWLSSIDPSIPLHLSRFFPRYKYTDKKPTSRETILRLKEKAEKYLKNVFCGNM